MTHESAEISEKFGNRLRLRVCGICWQGEKLLLINHRGLSKGDFWAPPGGGMDFGEPAQNALKREFLEETGLSISVGRLMFVAEFIKAPLHAVELFFEVSVEGGNLINGRDPEMSEQNQIIRDVAFRKYEEIKAMAPPLRHGLFEVFATPEALKKASGYRII